MDRPAFAQKVLGELRRAEPAATFELEEEEFRIRHVRADGTQSLVMLHNFYDVHESVADEAARAAVILRIVHQARTIDSQETLGEVRTMLVPRIRARRYFEVDVRAAAASLEGAAKASKGITYEPLGEHLGVALAIDRPEQIEYVMDGPSRFGLTAEELHAIALVNLKRMTPSGLEEVRPGLWCGHWGDDYAVERILQEDLLASLSVQGEAVVFMPSAEAIYVVDSTNAEAMTLALGLVDQRKAEPRSLLDFGFVRKDGVWTVFAPPGELGRRMGARLALHLADTYAPQKKALEAEPIGEEFVASVMGIAEKDELVATLSTWGKDVPTLLPRVQLLAIMREMSADGAMTVPWEDVMELAGDCLEQVPDLYPPRWRTVSFPDDATLAKLATRATGPTGGPKPASAPKAASKAASVSATGRRSPIVGPPIVPPPPPVPPGRIFGAIVLIALLVGALVALTR
jgi:hypothetical protein